MIPFIIAELSCNHLGSIDRALALCDAAFDAGADAVKLQSWHTMTISDYVIPSGPWAGRRLHSLYAEAKTPWEWHERLFIHCRNIGIECFSTAFDRESVEFLESLGCPRYKVASFEITDLELIRRVAQTGKPMIVSTGMATEDEIVDAVGEAEESGCTDLTILRCASAYPAPAAALNLRTMTDMRRYAKVGVSDHTLGTTAAVAATALGATVIEKHLTLSRADGGPDSGFSVEPHEFKAMVAACRDAHAALGAVRYGPTEAERDSLQFRRSLYFTRDLIAGTVLGTEDVRAYRPALGLPPSTPVVGERLHRAARRGDPVTKDHF